MQKLNNGKYRVLMRVAGKRRSHTFTHKRDAEKKEAELKQAQELIRAGMEAPRENILFIDGIKSWLRGRERDLPMATVAMDASRAKNYLVEPLGGLALSFISSKLIKDVLDEAQTRNNLSNATRNRIRALLHTFFQDAFMDGLVIANPVTRVPLLHEKRVQKKPLTLEEVEVFMEKASKRGERVALLIASMIFEGRRVSEAVALKNSDFDLERNELHVRRIWEQESGGIEERIKGRPDGILIPLFPRARQAYENHLRATRFNRPHDFCMTLSHGQTLSTYAARSLVKKIAREAQLPHVTPHVLRATFATLAEEAGFSKEDIQRMLGHSTILVTERYTRRTAQPLLEKGARLGFGTHQKSKGDLL